jgi:hypothetical protein
MSESSEFTTDAGLSKDKEFSDTQRKTALGVQLWNTLQGQKSKFFYSVQKADWAGCRAVLTKMVESWGGQALDADLDYMWQIIELFSGRYWSVENIPGDYLIPAGPNAGKRPPAMRRQLTYAAYEFQEKYFNLFERLVRSHVTGLFDPYIRAGFTSAAKESEASTDELLVQSTPEVPFSAVKDQRHTAVALAYTFSRLKED